MKKWLFTVLVGLAMVGFTGCTSGSNAGANVAGATCSTPGCTSCEKCEAKKTTQKCQSKGKCAGDMEKKSGKKCKSSGKCG